MWQKNMARKLLEPSNSTFLCVTQWPHLVLWAHGYFNAGARHRHTNLLGCVIFVACYAFAVRHILTSPRLATFVGAAGLYLVPSLGAFDGLSKAGYALASLCHFIRLVQITKDLDTFRETSWLYRYKFLSWVGSDLRTSETVSDAERNSQVANSLREKFVSLLLCVSCHVCLEKKLPFSVWGNLAGRWPCAVTRWLVSGIFFYNSLHMLDLVYRIPLLGLEGVRVVATHDNPIMAKSLSDFWGKKWDKESARIQSHPKQYKPESNTALPNPPQAVQMMLKDVVFTPVFSQYGLQAAVWLTFAASGVLHVYALLWAGCSWVLCGYMLVFFVLQPILLELERRFKLPWFPMLLLAAPLFLEPFLTICGW